MGAPRRRKGSRSCSICESEVRRIPIRASHIKQTSLEILVTYCIPAPLGSVHLLPRASREPRTAFVAIKKAVRERRNCILSELAAEWLLSARIERSK